MGGCIDIWGKSKARLGAEGISISNINSIQNYCDHKMEFFSYDDLIKMGLERYFHGFAHKIYQNNGKMKINFKPHLSEPVYLNVDGEFYELNNPEYAYITPYDKCINHRLSFLIKN